MSDVFSIPIEIFLHICDFLCVDDILALRLSCKYFDKCLKESSFWRHRLLSLTDSVYPCVPKMKLNWETACILREKASLLFGKSDKIKHFACVHNIAHCIDAVHILRARPCHFAVGDRGGVLSIFSFKDVKHPESCTPILTDSLTHKSWIWTITSNDNLIATGDWSGHLRLWTQGERLVPIVSFKLNLAVLCSDFLDVNLIAAGTAGKSVVLLDARTESPRQVLSNSYHLGPVLCLSALSPVCGWDGLGLVLPNSTGGSGTEGDPLEVISPCGDRKPLFSPAPFDTFTPPYGPSSTFNLFTGSKDRLLAAWDIRWFSRPISEIKLRRYPRAISVLDSHELWVSEYPNILHIFATQMDDSSTAIKLRQVCKYALPDSWTGVGALQATPGAIYVAGTQGVVDVFHPTSPPVPMSNVPLFKNTHSPPICLAYANQTLVVGTGNGEMHIWTP